MTGSRSSLRATPPMRRFSSIVRFPNTFSVWGTYPIPARTMSSGAIPPMSFPWYVTWPVHGVSIPNTVFRTVDFPAPFGPTRHAISFSASVIDRSSSTCTSPYPESTFSTERTTSSSASRSTTPVFALIATALRAAERERSLVRPSEVGVDDAVVVPDGLGRAFDEHAPLVEDDDGVCEVHNEVHVV